jgi:GTP-binding protein
MDKLSATEQEQVTAKVAAALKSHPAALPELITTSARKNSGIAELRADLATLANPQ